MMGHENRGGDDEGWRQTMPGGWPDDDRSVFTEEGRTDKENETIDWISAWGNWRLHSPAAQSGKLLHFVPENGVYVYFRIHEKETLMIIMNSNEDAVTLDANRYKEVLKKFSTGVDVISGEETDITKDFGVGSKTTAVWELN
jgi:hypothetical protein